MKIITTEQNKEKKNEDSLRDIWDNIKHTNIHTTQVQEGEERQKGPEKIFAEIIAKNVQNMGKQTITQVQEIQ